MTDIEITPNMNAIELKNAILEAINMHEMNVTDLKNAILEVIMPETNVKARHNAIINAIDEAQIEKSNYWKNLEKFFPSFSSPYSSFLLLLLDLDPVFLSQYNQYRKNLYGTLQKFGVQCSECSYSDASISSSTSAKRNLVGFLEKVYTAEMLCKRKPLAILNSHFQDITCTIKNPHQLFDNEGSGVYVSFSPTTSLKNLSTFPDGVVNFISHLLLIARSGYNFMFPPKDSVQLKDITAEKPGLCTWSDDTPNKHIEMILMAYLSQKLLIQSFKSQSTEIDCKSCEEQTIFNICVPAQQQQLEISLYNRAMVFELCNELATKLSSTITNENQCEPLTYQNLAKHNYLLSCYAENPSALLTDPNYPEDLVEKVSIAIAGQDIGAAGNIANIADFMIET